MGGWWWLGGVQSHFHVQPNYSVEVVLGCVVVGVVTKISIFAKQAQILCRCCEGIRFPCFQVDQFLYTLIEWHNCTNFINLNNYYNKIGRFVS